MIVRCESPKHFRVHLENEKLYFAVYPTDSTIWESMYYEGMKRIFSVDVKKDSETDPEYGVVPPYALPLVHAYNFGNSWTSDQLQQLFDLDYSGQTCITAYPEAGKTWILKIRIPLLTGQYHSNLTSVIITADFMECDDPIKTMVSTVNNPEGMPGKRCNP